MLDRTRSFGALVLLMTSLLSACGGDPVGLEGDPLSEAEIQAVFDAFSNVFSSLGAAPTSLAGVAGAGPAAASVRQSFDTSAPCQQGGAIGASGSVSGSVDDETFASDLRFELVFAPDGCVVSTAEGTVTVDGAPDIRIIVNSLFDETQISMSGSEQGGIRFTTSDGRSGTCPIDVAFSTTADLSTGTGEQSVSGTVCGVSASRFEMFGAG